MRTKATYNLAGMVEQLELDRGTGSGYEIVMQQARFNARGQPTSHLAGNGVLTTKGYDPDIERLLRIFTKLPGSPDVRLQDQNYAYDPAGNPVQITDALAETTYRDNQVIPNTRTFRYDPRYRLVRATGKRHSSSAPDKTGDIAVPTPTSGDYEPYTIRYSYDEVGNFTTNQEYKSGTNNLHYKADRIDLFNGDASEAVDDDPAAGNYTYDDNGNTLKTPRIAELVYTHDDQPVFVDMGGGGVVRYARHADQRVLRFVNKTGVKSVRIYLGPFEYERRTGGTAYTKLTLHCEGSGVSCQAERVLAGSDSASLTRLWRHQDHLGSGQILTKADSTLLSQEEYYPYGRPSDRRESRNRYRYIGVERDEDTGLCMTGPRTYDPVVGRFLQCDPRLVGDASPFAYCAGNPLRSHDRSGYGSEVATPGAEITAVAAEKADLALAYNIDFDDIGVSAASRESVNSAAPLAQNKEYAEVRPWSTADLAALRVSLEKMDKAGVGVKKSGEAAEPVVHIARLSTGFSMADEGVPMANEKIYAQTFGRKDEPGVAYIAIFDSYHGEKDIIHEWGHYLFDWEKPTDFWEKQIAQYRSLGGVGKDERKEIKRQRRGDKYPTPYAAKYAQLGGGSAEDVADSFEQYVSGTLNATGAHPQRFEAIKMMIQRWR